MKKIFLTSAILVSLTSPALASEIQTADQTLDFITNQIEKAIEDMDINDDAFISLEEYTDYNNERAYYFDRDDNRILNKDEYSDFIISQLDELTSDDPEMRTEFKQMKNAEVDMIMQQFDTDKNNGLSEKELRPIFAHDFSKTDINQDNKIDASDIKALKSK